jgi:hypothetical protein
VFAVLQTLRTTLEAAQQAAAAAASRSALRQRHQQQLASLLGSDSRPAHSHSLRRALLGERLLLEQVCVFENRNSGCVCWRLLVAVAVHLGCAVSLQLPVTRGSCRTSAAGEKLS